MNFERKMETTLGEMRKLFSGSQAEGPSQPPLPIATLQKEKQWEELRTRLQQRSVKEVTADKAKEVPPTEFPTTTPTAKAKKMEKDLETKTTSSEPSSQRRSARKKTKEPSPESEEKDESIAKDMGSSSSEPKSEEEVKPVTPLPKKRKRMDTQASDKKKPTSAFKTLVAPMQLVKTMRKEESFQKKPRGK